MQNVHKKYFLIILFLLWTAYGKAQVGIGTVAPHSSAVLDVTSNTKGVLIPRLTNSEAATLSGTSPAQGLLIYNTDQQCVQIYSGTSFQCLIAGTSADFTNDAWVNDTINTMVKLGAKSDGMPRTTGSEMVVKDDGKWGIGTEDPQGALHIHTSNSNDIIFSKASNTASEDMDIDLVRLRYSGATPLVPQSGDALGGLRYKSYTGSSSTYNTNAEISAFADGTITSSSNPGGMVFRTTPANSLNPSDRITIKSDGKIGIGLSNPVSLLDIKGKMHVNNQQTIYNAGVLDLNFLNSIFMGNGGQNLAHSSGVEGQANTGMGTAALLALTTGYANTGVGAYALTNNTTGNSNVAMGYASLSSNITGNGNTTVGYQSLFSNSTGRSNTGFGSNSLFSNTTGINNVASGYQSLSANKTGDNNTVMGYRVLNDDTSGSGNTVLGYNTGRGIMAGSNNTILGANVTGLSSSLNNNIIIADGAGNRRINVDSLGKTGIGTITPNSTLQVNGSLATTIRSSTSSGTLTGADSYIMATGNITLPAASSCQGREYHIKNTGTAKTISAYYDISGTSTTTLPASSVIHLVSDGTDWQQF